MSCHLHDLIESVNKKESLCVHPVSTEDYNNIINAFTKFAPQAICFDMGDVDEMPTIAPVYEMVKEPFPTCWFECNFIHTDGTQIILGMLVIVEEKAQIICFRYKHKQWCVRGVIVVDSLSTYKNFGIFPPVDEITKELRQHKIVLSTFLSALNCKNVKRVEHKPDTKLQKARSKKGKLPLFSHWTLVIKIPDKSQSPSATKGSKSSPRVHLRRGHPRQYSPGKWTWVQPSMVGGNKGIITKDYSANYLKNEQ